MQALRSLLLAHGLSCFHFPLSSRKSADLPDLQSTSQCSLNLELGPNSSGFGPIPMPLTQILASKFSPPSAAEYATPISNTSWVYKGRSALSVQSRFSRWK